MSKKGKEIGAQMVGWYDPGQLLDTAKKTFISTTIGEYADPRGGSGTDHIENFFDYSTGLIDTGHDVVPEHGTERDEIWIDYAADVGDGWNSTYAVAFAMSGRRLSASFGGEEYNTRRGELLILGGDGVYPTADPDAYERRLVEPYRMASMSSGPKCPPPPGRADLTEHPHIFVLPGNHDWYDGLVAFKKLFCSHILNGRRFAATQMADLESNKKSFLGGWRTRQHRSYFAIKLPRKWWVLGVDLQLTHNIDVTQLEYFERVADQMDDGDSVILCVPEPYWVKAMKYQNITDKFDEKEKSVQRLERFFSDKGIQIKLYLAGDLHHYRRFSAGGDAHQITAGGGGAFLHPTHDFDFVAARKKLLAEAESLEPHVRRRLRFELAASYPEVPTSRSLDWRNFKFVILNPKFGAVTGAVYFVLSWFVYSGLEAVPKWVSPARAQLFEIVGPAPGSLTRLGSFLGSFVTGSMASTYDRLTREPLAVWIIVLMVLALIFFTDSHSKTQKYLGGVLHAFSHLAAAYLIGWFLYLLAAPYLVPDAPLMRIPVVATVGVGILVLGWLVGSVLMGLYLFVSLHIFGRHDNEAFSALRIEDYKNFLRLHIGPDGLTVYPFKIDTVPRRWKSTDFDAGTPHTYYVPDGDLTPKLIERPIVISETVGCLKRTRESSVLWERDGD